MKDLKEIIVPHRAYRTVRISKTNSIRDFILLLICGFIPLLFFAGKISFGISFIVHEMLQSYSLEVVQHRLIIWDMFHLASFGKFPSGETIIISAVLSGILTVVFFNANFLKNVFLFLSFACFVVFFSSVYFFFFAEHFPYSFDSFFQIYMDVFIISWITVAFLFLLLIFWVPESILKKLLLMVLFHLTLFVVNTVKYAFAVVVVKEFSYLFIPIIFVFFGAIFDFIYLVLFHSLLIESTIKKISSRKDAWIWNG